jgi:hypothetical protein
VHHPGEDRAAALTAVDVCLDPDALRGAGGACQELGQRGVRKTFARERVDVHISCYFGFGYAVTWLGSSPVPVEDALPCKSESTDDEDALLAQRASHWD